MVFLAIIGSILLGNLYWWARMDRRLRRLKMRRWWRIAAGAFILPQLIYLVWFFFAPGDTRSSHAWAPRPFVVFVYLWSLLILPATLIAGGLMHLGRRIGRWTIGRPPNPAGEGLSRRQFLAAAAVVTPPLLTAGVSGVALRRLNDFRIRPIEVTLPQLPPELDGLTIAHVSDIHLGRFTRLPMVRRVIDATNALKADLVLFTGDLIDLSLADLSDGIDQMRRLDPRHGLFLCEGNHDLIESRQGFESMVQSSGLPLLLDEGKTIRIRGRSIQLLGLRWLRGERGLGECFDRLLPRRDPQAMQILLAHHPHAFDPAAAAGIPLTLSGHTHGGQLMLNEKLGAGPIMYRYWSGLYYKGPQALVVSNGVGNWYPLRIHAPAEIIHLTLRKSRRIQQIDQ